MYDGNEVIELNTDLVEKLIDKWDEHLDYVIRGAWRAEYDYVHVYRPTVSTGKYKFPMTKTTNQKIPPDSPKDYFYAHTYLIEDMETINNFMMEVR